MRRRNQILLLLVAMLLAANLLVLLVDGKSSGKVSADYFDFPDTTAIESVRFTRNDASFFLVKEDDSWQLNETYAIDADFRNILMAVFSRVKVQKRVAGSAKAELLSRLEAEGTFVNLNGGNVAFWVLGNPTRTQTYFVSEDEADVCVVGIPGYNDFVGGIFQLTEMQWRDRTLFAGSIRTIQRINIDYLEGNDLDITYNGDFFNVNDVQPLDTAFLEDYFAQFRKYQANERLPTGRFARYDSLAQTTPMAIITIEDLTRSAPWEFRVFPTLPRDNFHLSIAGQEEMVVVDRRRMQQLLREPSDFEFKAN